MTRIARSRHPFFAFVYGRLLPRLEEAGVRGHRQELLSGLTGRILEVGCGAGSNFAHYPDTVSSVIAVEPEPSLFKRAERAPRSVRVELLPSSAERLPLSDDSVDAVVFSLVLCSVSDEMAALGEAMRVLRPGGELRFYEHVRAADSRRADRQDHWDLLWPHLAGGCHCSRDTPAAIAKAGFRITSLRGFDFPERASWLPVAPHVLGIAVRPS